ncbi:CPXCG motif-containing cysteine-rich protein [Halomonas sp. MCCC 1A11036]|uniref:CPXCG motif-containing cysteine-rich protein n=1 Tax=Billgrantia zhangzhouensis TaxID=2733481 RepID=A0ABS9AGF4_9GAMM|nr:CPXCG motif-containing cysteine-rich protein [Halomonas zhangzhouensis]MCE8020755.1 CPXCG motif-containing cysteine-rich protein [Halomonas zhangzhouensis]
MHEDRLDSYLVHCPYCSMPFDLLIDVSQGSHATWEDCPYCCSPIQVRVEVSPIASELEALVLGRDDEVL